MESEINDLLLDTLELDFCIERTIFVEIVFKILPILTWVWFSRKFVFFEPEPSAVYGVVLYKDQKWSEKIWNCY